MHDPCRRRSGVRPLWITAAVLLLAGCVPTVELDHDGGHTEFARDAVGRFCAAVRSGEAARTGAVLVPSLAARYERAVRAVGYAGVPLTSRPASECGSGRVWALGWSRLFPEVRLSGGSDRLDVWLADDRRVTNVLYGRPVTVSGRKVKSLEEALGVLTGEKPGGGE